MAKPLNPDGTERPLVLKIDPEDLTLDEIALFDGEFKAAGFRAFMAKYSDWTEREVGALTMRELKGMAADIMASVNGTVVPKVNNAA